MHSGRDPARDLADVGQLAGIPVQVPVFLVPSTAPFSALSPASIRACLTSPTSHRGPGWAPGAPQVVNAELSVKGVLSPVPRRFFRRHPGAVDRGYRNTESGGNDRHSGGSRTRRRDDHGEEIGEGRHRQRGGHAGRSTAGRSDGQRPRRLREGEAHDTQASGGLGERTVHARSSRSGRSSVPTRSQPAWRPRRSAPSWRHCSRWGSRA